MLENTFCICMQCTCIIHVPGTCQTYASQNPNVQVLLLVLLRDSCDLLIEDPISCSEVLYRKLYIHPLTHTPSQHHILQLPLHPLIYIYIQLHKLHYYYIGLACPQDVFLSMNGFIISST